MSDLTLSDGQEFYIGGQRYVVKDGVPVQEAKRGPLGGRIVKAGGVASSCSDSFVKVRIAAINNEDNSCKFYLGNSKFKLDMPLDDFNLMGVETDIPLQPQQAKGRVMTAGEAAKLPDIVGKRVLIECEVNGAEAGFRPLVVSPNLSENPKIDWRLANRIVVEVLD